MAVNSPSVLEIATGEIVSFEELGGVDVRAKTTGQIDLGVDSYEEAYKVVQQWLSSLLTLGLRLREESLCRSPGGSQITR